MPFFSQGRSSSCVLPPKSLALLFLPRRATFGGSPLTSALFFPEAARPTSHNDPFPLSVFQKTTRKVSIVSSLSVIVPRSNPPSNMCNFPLKVMAKSTTISGRTFDSYFHRTFTRSMLCPPTPYPGRKVSLCPLFRPKLFCYPGRTITVTQILHRQKIFGRPK